MKKTYATKYLLPLTGQTYTPLYYNGFQNAYLKDADRNPDGALGENLFLLFKKKDYVLDPEDFINYIDEYDIGKKYKMVVISIEPHDFVHIVEPLLAGQYSKIDRNYVERNFPRIVARLVDGFPSFVKNEKYQVLFQDEELRDEIETMLDVTLPENAELDSIPDSEFETFKYSTYEDIKQLGNSQ